MLSEVFLPKKKYKNFVHEKWSHGLKFSPIISKLLWIDPLYLYHLVAPVVQAKKNGTQWYAMFMSGIEPETFLGASG